MIPYAEAFLLIVAFAKNPFHRTLVLTPQTTTLYLKTNDMKQIKLSLLTAISQLFLAAVNFFLQKRTYKPITLIVIMKAFNSILFISIVISLMANSGCIKYCDNCRGRGGGSSGAESLCDTCQFLQPPPPPSASNFYVN